MGHYRDIPGKCKTYHWGKRLGVAFMADNLARIDTVGLQRSWAAKDSNLQP